MKKILIYLLCCVFTGLVFATVFFYTRNLPVEVDNETPAENLITHEYGLMRLLKIEALGNVYDGFYDCNVRDLAKECGVKLECKRQTAPNAFYYIVSGDGYRCFLFVDKDDTLQRIIVTRGFLSQENAKSIIEELETVGNYMLIDEVSNNNLRASYSICRRATGHDYLYFPLSDGMMIMRRPDLNVNESPKYYLYDNDSCEDAKKYWSNYLSAWDWSCEILEIDRTPW